MSAFGPAPLESLAQVTTSDNRPPSRDGPIGDSLLNDPALLHLPPLRRMGNRSIADAIPAGSPLRGEWRPGVDGLGDRVRSRSPSWTPDSPTLDTDYLQPASISTQAPTAEPAVAIVARVPMHLPQATSSETHVSQAMSLSQPLQPVPFTPRYYLPTPVAIPIQQPSPPDSSLTAYCEESVSSDVDEDEHEDRTEEYNIGDDEDQDYEVELGGEEMDARQATRSRRDRSYDSIDEDADRRHTINGCLEQMRDDLTTLDFLESDADGHYYDPEIRFYLERMSDALNEADVCVRHLQENGTRWMPYTSRLQSQGSG